MCEKGRNGGERNERRKVGMGTKAGMWEKGRNEGES